MTTTIDIASIFDRLEVWAGWLASHWQDLTDEQRVQVLAKQEQVDRKLRELERVTLSQRR